MISSKLNSVVLGMLLVAPMALAEDQWKAVESGAFPNAFSTSGAKGGRSGDRLYIAQRGDNLKKIALTQTGDEANWHQIAQYNQLGDSVNLGSDSMILIPQDLLKELQGRHEPKYEIQEFKEDTSQAIVTEEEVAPLVETKRVDLFAGQVEVLAKVAVQRVAVGNGGIIRAEVLKTGELLVIAKAAGSTSLRLWHKDGRQTDFNIRVSEHDNETRFPMQKMVRMKVKMVEFRKSALGRLGIDWADGVEGPTFATAGDVIGNNLFRPAQEGFSGLPNTVAPFSTYFGIASNITSRINFLASNGDAVTLAEPVLTATNGGTASFLAGGEVPYPAIGTNGQTQIEFKEYGIRLDISPQIDPEGNVRTSVETEISQLDPAVSIQGTPGLLTRRAQTHVNVRSGETIVISGLLSSESSNDIDKLPGLGNLPILGAFFKSKNVRNSTSEMVIFVTPEVIEPDGTKLTQRSSSILERAEAGLERARQPLTILD